MADKKVIAESNVTAQQMKEFWGQVVSGKINRQNLQIFLEEKKGLFDPHKFFQNSEGLWRSEAFVERILSVAKKTERILLPSHIPSLTLHKNMNDTEVCKELGDNYVFEATEGGVVIAEMINRQPNGEDGDLVNDGKANIFYVHGKDVEVFAVHVSWDAGVREWNVRAYRLDDDRWPAGHRAFSRNSTFGN